MRLSKLLKRSPSSLAIKPSDFGPIAEDVVNCNRPFDSNTIPIDLFQPEFGQFKTDRAEPPTAWAQKLLQELTTAACKWYNDETGRRSEIHDILRDNGFSLAAQTINGTEHRTDGNSSALIMPAVIRECKNEFGFATAEAIAYYAQFLKREIRYHRFTRFPSILLVDVGMLIAMRLFSYS